jgi:VWFA-related protein
VSFSSEDVPISIGVIFDHSGSMANKLGKAEEAAIQFFKTANPQDEFFLVGFNDRAELLSPFTDSVEDLQSRILSAPAKGRTALFDGIYLGLSQMKAAHRAKRALLVISDGGDNRSRYNEKDIKRLVREADTQIYSIGIFDPLGHQKRLTCYKRTPRAAEASQVFCKQTFCAPLAMFPCPHTRRRRSICAQAAPPPGPFTLNISMTMSASKSCYSRECKVPITAASARTSRATARPGNPS